MRILTYILLCMLLPNVFIQASQLDFSYTYNHRESKFNLELYELTKVFEENKFRNLSSFPNGNIPMIHADEVMRSSNHAGSIFIKIGLIAPKNIHYKIIEGQGFYLFHTKNASIAFFDFTQKEVAYLTKDLVQSYFSKIKFNDLFISSAVADEMPCGQSVPKNFNQIEKIHQVLSQELILKKLGECGVSALRGLTGKVEGTKEFFEKLKNNPLVLWQEMKKSFESLKQFTMNISEELKSFYNSVSGLGIHELLEIGCAMIGESIPGLLMVGTGVGAGFGAAKLTASLIPKMQKLKNLLNTSKNRKFLSTEEAISCALKH